MICVCQMAQRITTYFAVEARPVLELGRSKNSPRNEEAEE